MMRQSLLGLLLLSAGCVELEVSLRDPASRKGETVSPAALATPITAEQVTPANARQMAHALWAEMDQEEQARIVTERKTK